MIMGVGIEFMARQFAVSPRIWQHYENDRTVIPDVLLLKDIYVWPGFLD